MIRSRTLVSSFVEVRTRANDRQCEAVACPGLVGLRANRYRTGPQFGMVDSRVFHSGRGATWWPPASAARRGRRTRPGERPTRTVEHAGVSPIEADGGVRIVSRGGWRGFPLRSRDQPPHQALVGLGTGPQQTSRQRSRCWRACRGPFGRGRKGLGPRQCPRRRAGRLLAAPRAPGARRHDGAARRSSSWRRGWALPAAPPSGGGGRWLRRPRSPGCGWREGGSLRSPGGGRLGTGDGPAGRHTRAAGPQCVGGIPLIPLRAG
jgi:hypothetical protein